MSTFKSLRATLLLMSLTATIRAAERDGYMIGARTGQPSRQQFAVVRGPAIELTCQVLKPVFERKVQLTQVGNRMIEETYKEEKWVIETRTHSMPISFIRGITADQERLDGDELAKRLKGGRMVIAYPKGQEPEPAYLAIAKGDTVFVFVPSMEEMGYHDVSPGAEPAAPKRPELRVPISLSERLPGSAAELPGGPQPATDFAPFASAAQPEVGFASIDEQSQVKLRRTGSVTAKHRTQAVAGSPAATTPVDVQVIVSAEVTELIPDEAVRAFDLNGKPVAREVWTRALKTEAPVVVSPSAGPVHRSFLQFVKAGTLVLAVPKMPPRQTPKQRLTGRRGNAPAPADDVPVPMPPMPTDPTP